jgi:hypothetical protein
MTNVEVGTKTSRGTVVRVLGTADVLHCGWEMDNDAWAVELDDGSVGVLFTSHFSPYSPPASHIEGKIKEAEDSAASLRKLLSLVQ